MFWIYLWFGSIIGIIVFAGYLFVHSRDGAVDTAWTELITWLARLSILIFIVCLVVFITDYINLYM